MIEHERSFVFSYKGAEEFLKSQNILLRLIGADKNDRLIIDYYLDKHTRVRAVQDLGLVAQSTEYFITRKTGDKSKGFRFEDEQRIAKGCRKSN